MHIIHCIYTSTKVKHHPYCLIDLALFTYENKYHILVTFHNELTELHNETCVRWMRHQKAVLYSVEVTLQDVLYSVEVTLQDVQV